MNRKIGEIFSWFAGFIPTTNLICFSSFPDYSDNAYAMYLYMIKTGLNNKYRLVWLVSERDSIQKVSNDVCKDTHTHVVYKYSFLGLWSYIRARYVFETHGLFPALKLNQPTDKHICLWHGMPLKHIGASMKEGKPCSVNFNYTIASSKIFQPIMAESFACSLDKVIVTGQPRCDLLFEPTDWFDEKGINLSKYEKIGIWMPTYRKSIIGIERLDGTYNNHGVSFLEEDEIRQLDILLRKMKTLLLLKIHPMDALQNASFEGFSNIVFIRPQDFHSQLYPLLGACDFLLTDYSSVFIDYQILRRPIGFVMNDIEEYRKSRGLYFEDLEEALPGPVLSTPNQLYDFIKNPFLINVDVNYNDFYDNCSSERICRFLSITES